MAIDQIDSITSTGMSVSAKVSDSVLPSTSTHIVLMSGDDVSAAADVKVIALAAEEPAVTVTFKNGTSETALAADKATTITKPANIALSDLTLTTEQQSKTYALSELKFIGWTDKASANETVYVHSTDDIPAYEISTNSAYNPSGAAYKTLADLANIEEDITLYAKYDTGYVKGDVNGDGKVAALDRGAIVAYLKPAKTVVKNTYTGLDLFPLLDDVVGDVSNDHSLAALDRGAVVAYLKPAKTVVKNTYTNEHIYYIND